MKTTELATKLGVTAKKVRTVARKLFGTNKATWTFTPEQVTAITEAIKTETPKTKSEKSNGLTAGENLVLDYLINTGWFEQGFSDQAVADIAEGIDKPIASVKGYCGSLVKKNYIWISEAEGEVPPLVYAKETHPTFGKPDPNAKLTYNEETGKYEY